ncbi:SGNH/GDSL hydrolase family protein [Rossellomorea vietnamensis]|uniref:SGNH/GDSL hydrolase family protein n=2 Tax=Rossellomorea vietnamensis TaxID=218284 RepID=A0A5D4P0E0_9BACI|nr:SGNH/GDSL hydrolase family protein [Rossellomorea vietnamensis]
MCLMKKILFSLLFILLVISGCSSENIEPHPQVTHSLLQKEQPPADFIPKDIKIVSIGDSLTQGVGDSTKSGGYVPFLQSDLERLDSIKTAEFTNYGVRGNRTDQLLKRLKSEEVSSAISDSDLVFITIGGNDVMKVFKENLYDLNLAVFNKEMVNYADRLREILTLIRQYNPDGGIVLVGIYNPFNTWFSEIKEVDEIILNWNLLSEEVLAEYDRTAFVKINEIFIEGQDSLLFEGDYFHPNDDGYELMAERMFEELTERETLAELTQSEFIVGEEGL